MPGDPESIAPTVAGTAVPGDAARVRALLVGGWILLAIDGTLLVLGILDHDRAAEGLTSRLNWTAMPDDPDVARWFGTWTYWLGSLGLAAQTGAVWLATRWRRWRLEPAGTSPNLPAAAVLLVAFLWNLGSAVAVVFTTGGERAEVAANVSESILSWRALLDLANAAALVAAWRWRPWRGPQVP